MRHRDNMLALMRYLFLLLLCIDIFSCKKLVSIDVPATDINRSQVFTSDLTATAAVTGIYSKMIATGVFTSGDLSSCHALCGLSADELTSYSSNQTLNEFYNNALTVTNTTVAKLWSDAYSIIYSCNSILQGLNNATGISGPVKSQLTGEAYFIRAFMHFYLVNLFGKVPYIKSTDYSINSIVARDSIATVYTNIKTDLIAAQAALPVDYLDMTGYTTTARIRVNKYVATALLSRVYLYTGDYPNAELQASVLLNLPATFALPGLANTFLKASTEAIWQLQPLIATQEAATFILTSTPSNIAMTDTLYNSFESGDLRKTAWIGTVTTAGKTYHFAYKYRDRTGSTEYSMIFRLAEQYLIRAEARVAQGNVSGAVSDLNVLRLRAGLTAISSANADTLMAAVVKERRAELFVEWGHRWFDLKRWGLTDSTLAKTKPAWRSAAALFPIPQSQILADTYITQNLGY